MIESKVSSQPMPMTTLRDLSHIAPEETTFSNSKHSNEI